MRKVKILRIITRLNIGGPAIHAVLLSQAFDNERFETILVAGKVADSEGDMGYLAHRYGFRLIILPELSRGLDLKKDLISLYKIYKLIRKERPDILHTHTAKAGTLGRLASLAARVPVRIHTFHGHIFEGYFSKLKTFLFISIERTLAYFTHRITTVSEGMKEDLVRTFRITTYRKVRVIPLGFDLEDFFHNEGLGGKLKSEFALSLDAHLIGIVGRLVPIKNHKMFLDAAKVVLEAWDGPRELRFVVVGDGELKKELVGYTSEIRLSDFVIFLGWRRDLKEIYADLDIVVLTSLNEGTPVSIIEAMASGRPVVATDVGGVRDVVRDGQSGFLVSVGATDMFAHRILDLLKDDGLRKRFGEMGRVVVKEKFGFERLIRDIEGLYEQFYSEHKRFHPRI